LSLLRTLSALVQSRTVILLQAYLWQRLNCNRLKQSIPVVFLSLKKWVHFWATIKGRQQNWK